MYDHIFKLARLFYKLSANFDAIFSRIEGRGVPIDENVKNFIRGVPDENLRYYLPVLTKNPQITLQEVQEIPVQQVQKQKIDPYLPKEYETVKNLPEGMQRWALIQFRKIRGGKIPKSGQELDDVLDQLTAAEYLSFRMNLNNIRDWFNSTHPNLASYNYKQAIQAQKEWHNSLIAQEGGEGYREGAENIVYNVQSAPGWTIRKITGEHDLEVEGEKMGHCVGGYCRMVETGQSDIYSLRDPRNEPHVTMETTGGTYNFVQIYGKQNEEPDQKYKTMIREWFDVLKENGKNVTMEFEEDIIDRLLDMYSRYIEEELEKINGVNDYGIKHDLTDSHIAEIYSNLLSNFSNRNHNRDNAVYSSHRGAARVLARIALEADERFIDSIEKGESGNFTEDNDQPKRRHFKQNSSVETLLDAIETHEDEMNNHIDEYVFNNTSPMPDEDDYVDEAGEFNNERYKEAYDEWEEQQQSYYEYAHNEMTGYLPYGFDEAIVDELKNEFNKYIDVKPWMKGEGDDPYRLRMERLWRG